MKRTKIVATLGPATDDPNVLKRMINAGMDVARINFSHGSCEQDCERIRLVRQCAKEVGRPVGVIADMQGPKIRIARFKEGKVMLKEGAQFILDASLESTYGSEMSVGIDYKELPNDVHPGDTLLLDDGRVVLSVTKVVPPQIICQVEEGGMLDNNKGINRQGGGLSAGALTHKDRADIKVAVAEAVNYIAISFPRSAADVNEARALVQAAGGEAHIIAKIERIEAVEAIDEIIEASDGIMIARGDLAVEIGDAQVPGVQKHIIKRTIAMDKPVITATQMMESMITHAAPTRAEVSDVANAVLDTTDAVMLSAESAVGINPPRVVSAMAKICTAVEKEPSTMTSTHRMECRFARIDEVISMAATYAANHIGIAAIVVLTESGSTALMMSRIRTEIPIFGLTPSEDTLGKLSLLRNVYPIHFDSAKFDKWQVTQQAITILQDAGYLKDGDLVIMTKGDVMGVRGGTNTMKIVEVGSTI